MALVRRQLELAGQEPPSPAVLAALSILQPAVLLAVASAIGVGVAPKLRLRSRIAEWSARGRAACSGFARELPAASIGGVAAAIAIAALDVAARSWATAIGGPSSVLASREAHALLTAISIARIVSLNAIGGLLFGWLFRRRSLEAAMVAHALVHLVWAVGSVYTGGAAS